MELLAKGFLIIESYIMGKEKIQAQTTQVVEHDDFGQFRFIKTDDGEIQFIADDEADVHTMGVRSKNGVMQRRNVLCVNEPGLYRLIFMSSKP